MATFIYLLVVVLLSCAAWQSRMSQGMLIQLDVFVIFVMSCNLDTVIHKMVAWQLDTPLLSSAKEETNSDQCHWVGGISV